MDCLTFIASIIKSLAWPVVVAISVLVFKGEIVKIAPKLRRIKAGPVEAEFERDVEQLKLAARTSGDSIAAQEVDTASKDFLIQLARLHPRSAILESWIRVEAAARMVLKRKVPSAVKSSYIPAARLAEPLAQANIITEGQVALYHELRRLRNDVAHAVDFEPSKSSAFAYIDLAAFLQSHLEGSAS